MIDIRTVFVIFLLISGFVCAETVPGEGDPSNYNDPGKLTDAGNSEVAKVLANPYMAGCSADTDNRAFANSLVASTVMALLLVALTTAILYMVGNLLQSPNILALARQEVSEIAITAVIGLVFIGFIYATSAATTTSPAFPQSMFGVDLFQKATDYSYKMLYRISTVSGLMISANIALNSIYTIYIPLGPIRRAMTMQLGPALRPMIDGVSFSLQFLITTYGEWIAFVFMFCFIQKWFIPFFFPLGLLLRSFPQTRGGGNALIAISLALSTIYPLMFYVDGIVYNAQFPETGGAISTAATYFNEAIHGIFASLSIGGVGSIFTGLSFIYVSPFLVSGIFMAMYMLFDVAWEIIYLVMVFSILLPVMNIFATLAFAREVSRQLGTEISISAFAKLI